MRKIFELVDNTPYITDSQKQFYKTMLSKKKKILDKSLQLLKNMERGPIKDVKIKVLLKAALTDKVNDREVYMEGIGASCYYEGYNVYKTENIKNEE